MLSPLKPLLCRHDFYWSERHRSDRCRRCGKIQEAEAGDVLTREPQELAVSTDRPEMASAPLALDALPAFSPAGGVLVDFGAPPARTSRSPELVRPSTKVLKAQARERRAMLLALLDRLVEGARPSREEAIDAVLAVIEDAHSAEPLLFGPDAASQFARLHEARTAPRC